MCNSSLEPGIQTGKVHLVSTPEVKCGKAMSGSDMSHVLLHRRTHLAYVQPQSDCDSDGKWLFYQDLVLHMTLEKRKNPTSTSSLKKDTQICVGGGNLGLLSPGWWRSPSVLPQATSVHSEKRMYRHSSNGTIFLSFHQRRWLLQLKLAETRGHLSKSNLSNLFSSRHTRAKCCWPISHGRARNPLDDELKTRRLGGGIFSFGELVSCEPELTKWLAKKKKKRYVS